jgi:hypothetical protein
LITELSLIGLEQNPRLLLIAKKSAMFRQPVPVNFEKQARNTLSKKIGTPFA